MLNHAVMKNMRSVKYMGVDDVGNLKCHHLRFCGATVEVTHHAFDGNWDVWVETGSTPVLRRVVEEMSATVISGTRGGKAPPQGKLAEMPEKGRHTTVCTFEKWQFNEDVPDGMFAFTPPLDFKLDEFERSVNSANASVCLKAVARLVQDPFRENALVDQDGDGVGEYGFIQELRGTADLRGRKGMKTPEYFFFPDVVPLELVDGIFQGSGYCFKLYLPGDAGAALSEEKGKPLPLANAEGIDLQEKHFVLYAWPQRLGKTGNRAYAISEQGEVWKTQMDTAKYEGSKSIPAVGAVYEKEPFTSKFGRGSDGNTWVSDRWRIEPVPRTRAGRQQAVWHLKGAAVRLLATPLRACQ